MMRTTSHLLPVRLPLRQRAFQIRASIQGGRIATTILRIPENFNGGGEGEGDGVLSEWKPGEQDAGDREGRPGNPYFVFGSLFMVLRQRVQIFTLRVTPLISRRRLCTLSTKRRRVRFCEKFE